VGEREHPDPLSLLWRERVRVRVGI